MHAQLVLGSLKSSRDLRRIYLSSVGASSSHPNFLQILIPSILSFPIGLHRLRTTGATLVSPAVDDAENALKA